MHASMHSYQGRCLRNKDQPAILASLLVVFAAAQTHEKVHEKPQARQRQCRHAAHANGWVAGSRWQVNETWLK